MPDNNHLNQLHSLLLNCFAPAGFTVTEKIQTDAAPEAASYGACYFSLNQHKIIYRAGKVTGDRPGAYLTVWQRPASGSSNKPVPLRSEQMDFLIVRVHSPNDLHTRLRAGIFIFPTAVLTTKGILPSAGKPGKTGFRVFPPWSQNRGSIATQVFSESGKKSQRWQLPYFIEFDENDALPPALIQQALSKTA